MIFTAPKGSSVENSQAKGPELDETLERSADKVISRSPKKQFLRPWQEKESFRLQDGDALWGVCVFFCAKAETLAYFRFCTMI